MRLFRRVVNVRVAPSGSVKGFDLSDLDCSFHVKKTLKREPNTCELEIRGLARETRKVLETSSKLVLLLEAGYEDAVSQLFLGEIRAAESRREDMDIVTRISTGDSEEEMRKARLSLTVGPKAPVGDVLRAIASTLGVGLGNVESVATRLSAGGKAFFGQGTALSGKSGRLLDDFCRSADLEWSIQDGVLQILSRGKALDDKAVLLSPSTGLIGSPSIDAKGVLSVTALIQPDLRPGRKIVLESEFLRGGYVIQEVEYVGDTAGTEWYAECTCKAY